MSHDDTAYIPTSPSQTPTLNTNEPIGPAPPPKNDEQRAQEKKEDKEWVEKNDTPVPPHILPKRPNPHAPKKKKRRRPMYCGIC